MYKKILIVTALLLPFLASTGFSSVRIELKNGDDIVTNRYWREDGKVCFYFRSGIVGIPADTIHSISHSDQIDLETPEIDDSVTGLPDPSNPGPRTSDAVPLVGPAKIPEEPFDLKFYQKKKTILKAQLSASLKQLRKASRDKDPEAKEVARENTRKISRQIYDLTDEVKEKMGTLPDDWWQELTEQN